MSSKKLSKRQAVESVKSLFHEADKAFDKSRAEANRLIRKARRTSMKYKIRLPVYLKRRICKNCYVYLKPGKNCRVRVQRGRIIYYCLECKKFFRVGYRGC